MRSISHIIIHCTATPEGKDYTVADVDKWHKARGFKKIGYHYLIYRDGSVHVGRREQEVGAHAAGYNAHSIGVCYVGGLAKDGKTPKDTRTKAQRDALVRLLWELVAKYPDAEIIGHRDVAKKACPSFDAKKEYRII